MYPVQNSQNNRYTQNYSSSRYYSSRNNQNYSSSRYYSSRNNQNYSSSRYHNTNNQYPPNFLGYRLTRDNSREVEHFQPFHFETFNANYQYPTNFFGYILTENNEDNVNYENTANNEYIQDGYRYLSNFSNSKETDNNNDNLQENKSRTRSHQSKHHKISEEISRQAKDEIINFANNLLECWKNTWFFGQQQEKEYSKFIDLYKSKNELLTRYDEQFCIILINKVNEKRNLIISSHNEFNDS